MRHAHRPDRHERTDRRAHAQSVSAGQVQHGRQRVVQPQDSPDGTGSGTDRRLEKRSRVETRSSESIAGVVSDEPMKMRRSVETRLHICSIYIDVTYIYI